MRIFVNDYIKFDKDIRDSLDNNQYVITEEDNIKHLILVMRKTIKDYIEIVDLNQKAYQTEIINLDPLTVLVINEIDSTESNIQIDLYQGLPKFDKMEYIIEKAVELGVQNIYSVQMDRSIVRLNQKDLQKKVDRWMKISKSAAQQSKRNIIPKVKFIRNIKDIEFGKYDFNIFLDVENSKYNIKLNALKHKAIKKISVIIGPEGGFTDLEKEYLLENAHSLNLGLRVFRTETASVVALSLLQFILGDFERNNF